MNLPIDEGVLLKKKLLRAGLDTKSNNSYLLEAFIPSALYRGEVPVTDNAMRRRVRVREQEHDPFNLSSPRHQPSGVPARRDAVMRVDCQGDERSNRATNGKFMPSFPKGISHHTPPSILDEGVYVTRHALDRLHEHHPNAGVRGALSLLASSIEIEPGLAAAFLGRSLNGVRDRYFMSADRRGIFAVTPNREGQTFPWVLITWLRFGAYQQEVARRIMEAA